MDFTPYDLCFVCFSPPQPSPWSMLAVSWFGCPVTSELRYFLHADSPPSALHSEEEGILLCADVASSPRDSDTLDPLSWVPMALRMSSNSTTRPPRIAGFPACHPLPSSLHPGDTHPPATSFSLQDSSHTSSLIFRSSSRSQVLPGPSEQSGLNSRPGAPSSTSHPPLGFRMLVSYYLTFVT